MRNLAKSLEKLEKKADVIRLLPGYEEQALGYKEHLAIEGKTLQEACVENSVWFAYYDERRIEVNSMLKFMLAEMEAIKGKVIKNLTEGYRVSLGIREKEFYLANDPEFKEARKIYLQVEEIRDKFVSITEAFKNRGYDLRNITNARVAALENTLL